MKHDKPTLIDGRLVDPADNTKEVAFDETAITTATTRTWTAPDRDLDFSIGGTFAELVHTHTESDITDLGTYLENVVEDLTPELGGNLDALNKELLNVDSITLNTSPITSGGVGQLWWNDDTSTLNVGTNSDVTLQVGQEQHFYIKADSNITNGQAIMATGAVGASGKITAAPSDALPEDIYVIGIATEDITAGNFGYVTSFGAVRGIQTDGVNYGETWNDGDIIYDDPSAAGALTNVKPATPNHVVILAMVVKSHATAGTLFVRVSHGGHVEDLHDVKIDSVTDGELFVYNAGSAWWENQTLAEAGISAVGHTHVIADITDYSPTSAGIYAGSGTVPTTTVATLTDTLEFSGGNFGIGTTPSYKFHVLTSTTDTNSGPLAQFDHTYSPSSDFGAGYTQTLNTVIGGANDPAFVVPLYVPTTNNNTGTVLAYNGIYSKLVNNGDITTARMYSAELQNLTLDNITTWTGFSVTAFSNAGTVGDTYGVYVGDITAGTQTNTPYSFYASDSAAYNYFAGNVGIGTASPQHILHIQDSSGQTKIAIGEEGGSTSDLEGYSISAWNDNNVYLDTKVATGGKLIHRYGEGAQIGATNTWMTMDGGNVGIGETSPASPLHIKHSPAASSSGQDILTLDSEFAAATVGSGGQIKFRYDNDGTEAAAIQGYTFGAASTGLGFKTGWGALTTKMVIDNSGNVGIGTTTPATELDVAGDGAVIRITDTDTALSLDEFSGRIEFYTSDTNQVGVGAQIASIGEGTAGQMGLAFHTGTAGSAAERVRIDEAGNVGIGTTAPQEILDVNTGVMSDSIRIGNSSNVANGDNTSQLGEGTSLDFVADTNPRYSSNATDTVAKIKAEYDNSGFDTGTGDTALTFSTYDGWNAAGTLAERMRITGEGNVGIGTTAPTVALQVANATSAATLYTNDTTGHLVSDGLWVGYSNAAYFWNYEASNLQFATSNAARMTIDSSGNVGIGITAPTVPLHISHATLGTIILEDQAGTATLALRNDTATPAADTEVGRVNFKGNDSVGTDIGYARIRGFVEDDTTTAEKGYLTFDTRRSGSITEAARITHDGHILANTTDVEAWHDDYAAIEFAEASIVYNRDSSQISGIGLQANAYLDNVGYKYKTTAASAQVAVQEGFVVIKTATSGTADTALTYAASLRVNDTGVTKIGNSNALRATTEGTSHIDIFDGTAPVGTLANGISLYSTSGELRVMDAAGNATLLSPHDEDNNWIMDTYVGKGKNRKRIVVDMQKMLYALNEMFGWDFIHEFEI